MKNKVVGPSKDQWQELYRLAGEIKRLEPWTWMSEQNLFGVQNPKTGEIGYCSIMGALGEMYAIAVYLGPEGLIGWRKLSSGDVDIDHPDAMHIQKCLMLSFEDRDFIEKEDFKTIKLLGLKFRGRNAWPQFRSYQPGYVPWYLAREEASVLVTALTQALNVIKRFKENNSLLIPPDKKSIFVRIPMKGSAAEEWTDAWMPPPPADRNDLLTFQPDEIRIRRVKKNSQRQRGGWEMDYFYFPVPIDEGERPYFPTVFVIVDHSRGLVLQNWLGRQSELYSDFQEIILGILEQLKVYPEEILVGKPEAFQLLGQITSGLGTELRLVEELECVENLREEMNLQFWGDPDDEFDE
ncbi:MAG: hypothetical protein HQK58_13225 [Deltaproteobacteria bacterium]|nr:hypothetical protein [Deltaproteobacteria bacterium]